MTRFLRRRQGMTEYIIIVGLISILLVSAVLRYKNSVDTAIQGSTNKANNIASDIDAGLNDSGSHGARHSDASSSTGWRYADGTEAPPP